MERLDLEGGDVYLMRYQGSSELDRLKAETPWQQREMNLWGRKVKQPRLTAWYGDSTAAYTYSGIRNVPLPWTPLLLEIKGNVEELLQHEFNGCLLNLYRNGNDSIAKHSDDEPSLGPVVAAVSFGAPRVFTFEERHFEGQPKRVNVTLDDCSLLLMMGDTQKNWNHEIKKVKEAGERINLTFRNIL